MAMAMTRRDNVDTMNVDDRMTMTTTTTGSAGVRYRYVVRGARRKAHRTWPLERARARAHALVADYPFERRCCSALVLRRKLLTEPCTRSLR